MWHARLWELFSDGQVPWVNWTKRTEDSWRKHSESTTPLTTLAQVAAKLKAMYENSEERGARAKTGLGRSHRFMEQEPPSWRWAARTGTLELMGHVDRYYSCTV